MLLLHRYGFLEETYYSWKFVPMVGDEGYVVASYATVVEVTREIISDRRLGSLQNVGMQLTATKSMDCFWPNLLKGLEPNDMDLPIVMLYSVTMSNARAYTPQAEPSSCTLEGHLGVSESDVLALSNIDLTAKTSGIAELFHSCLNRVSSMLMVVERKALPQGLFNSTRWRGFGVRSEQFVLYPIQTRSGTLVGVMLIGLNPRRHFDSDYQDYIHLLTKQTTTHLSAILLVEEIKQSENNAKASALQRAELSSQLRQRTKEFEQSEDRFARFAGLANVGVATVDSNARLIYANPAWYEFNGLTPGCASQFPMLDSVIPEDEHIVREEWAKVLAMEPSQTFQIRTKKPFKMHSIEHGSMESTHRTGLCSAYPEIDEHGKFVSATALVMDISELKWIEDQVRLRSRDLEQSEIKYRNFADHAPIGVALLNSGGLIEYANEAW
jgi:PAS domain-containing protein